MIHGSETVAKDVLEFVVFEKHLANVYGTWRIHAKIIPDWLPAKEPGRLTYRVPSQKEDTKKTDKKEEDVEKSEAHEDTEEKESIYDRFGRIIGRK